MILQLDRERYKTRWWLIHDGSPLNRIARCFVEAIDQNMRPWALVTPASKGIGLALTRHLLQTTKVPIVATARKDLDQVRENVFADLKGVDESRLTVLPLDVTGRYASHWLQDAH